VKRNRKATFIGVALLMAALIASFWHLRSRPRAASPSNTASAAEGSPFVKPAKKPPARDFKRRSGYTITPRAEGEKPDAESPPHPLDAEIAARAERWKPWRVTQTTLNWTDTPLSDALADLTTRYGLKFLIAGDLDLTEKTVTFKVDSLAADQTIDLIFKMADLKWVLAADQTVVVGETAEDVKAWKVEDSDELKRLEAMQASSTDEKRTADKDDANDTYWAAVKGRVVKSGVASAELYDSLDALQETMQVNIVISSNARRGFESDPVIPAIAGGRTISETLDDWAAGAGLGWKVENRLIYIGTQAEITAARDIESQRRAERKARLDGLAALLARKVKVGGENLAVRQLAELLGSALGVPVRLDPVTWHRAARISLEETERTAEDVVRIMQSAVPLVVSYHDGILWFMAPVPPPENR
jgi:hypothetical protein